MAWWMCCASRGEEPERRTSSKLKRQSSWENVPDPEEFMIFHECAENFEELDHVRKLPSENLEQTALVIPRATSAFFIPRQVSFEQKLESPLAGRRRTFVVLRHDNSTPATSSTGPVPTNGRATGVVGSSSFAPVPTNGYAFGATGGHQGTPGPHEESIPRVAAAVRELWRTRREEGDLDEELARLLKEGFRELEDWTQPPTVRRMLRAMSGDEDEAANLLHRAIESRVRRRELYRVMRCPGKLMCDIRVIGRDMQQRPTIYMCARNQRGKLRDIIPQVFLAFEAAVRLSADRADGQVVLVADMHEFATRPNMDFAAFQELQESFGSVYADRLNFMLIVDFSWVAQTVWSMCKPLLSEKTKQKITFVSKEKARDIIDERFQKCTKERLLSVFEINRDPDSTTDEREAHAARTSITDVPLGCVELRTSLAQH